MSKPIKITEKIIIDFMKNYFIQYGKYPTSFEFESCSHKPCTLKTVDRKFGGYVKLKQKIGIKNPDDRKGYIRSQIASNGIVNSIISEDKFYAFLLEEFDKVSIHRWEPYKPGVQKRADYGIYTVDKKHCFVDIFWANNIRTMMACINIKLKKIPKGVLDPIFFVCTNPEISSSEINTKIINKKNKIPENVFVVTEEEFRSKNLGGKILGI